MGRGTGKATTTGRRIAAYDHSSPRPGWYLEDGVWEINPEEFSEEHLVPAPSFEELYHWAPRRAREQIRANGLRSSLSGAGLSCVYLTSSPKEWASLHETEEADLWIIDTRGLELFYDPEMMGGADTDFVHLFSIPPERLTGLVEQG